VQTSTLLIPIVSAATADLTDAELAAPDVQKHLNGKEIVNHIYAIGRLLNIVTK